MKRSTRYILVFCLSAVVLSGSAQAQTSEPAARRSPGKAFALSLVFPGLGHRYVHGGSWRGAASAFAVVETGIWIGLLGSEWQRSQIVDNYTGLARSRAGAIVEGKDRSFFLQLATYRSSDEFLEVSLRERAWDQLEYVSERTFQWEWESQADFESFRSLREDAESLRRRRPLLIAVMVGNRLLAGLTSIRAANRTNAALPASVSLALPPDGAKAPLVCLNLTF